MLAEHGLREGALWILERFAVRLDIVGHEHLPAEGPLMIVANHPGLTDFVSLCACLPRSDLRVMAADIPLLRSLHRVSPYLIYVPRGTDGVGRWWCGRRHTISVAAGGAAALPSGHIELDPARYPEAIRSLELWSESIGLS